MTGENQITAPVTETGESADPFSIPQDQEGYCAHSVWNG